ncbi:unnamed protein product [Periconia digitata]|uniref:Uncharacterized protein n=1 Tax=Periconia digitata TaxID=1303443 RepID=A0A9W4U5B4_9PLEO|nr:unnamed protein product [Periconia digitata]
MHPFVDWRRGPDAKRVSPLVMLGGFFTPPDSLCAPPEPPDGTKPSRNVGTSRCSHGQNKHPSHNGADHRAARAAQALPSLPSPLPCAGGHVVDSSSTLPDALPKTPPMDLRARASIHHPPSSISVHGETAALPARSCQRSAL